MTLKTPKNYRAIAIVSCFGKLFTAVLKSRLNKFSEEFSIICENQVGFRNDYFTIYNIFILHSLLNLIKTKTRKLFTVFIDFEKSL